MGCSTNAILAFGFDLGENDDLPSSLPNFENWDWDTFVDDDTSTVHRTDEEAKKIRSSYPVKLIHHCHGEHPMWFLAVNQDHTEARRGYPEVAKLHHPGPQAVLAMKEWCEKKGISWKEPSWHVMSYADY